MNTKTRTGVMMVLAVAGAVALAGTAKAADIGVTGLKLIILDKVAAASKAKAVCVVKDPGITKGSGTDPTDISGNMDVKYDATAGSWDMPQGANWLVNKSTVAKYVNKPAPSGGAVKVSVIKPSTLFKVVGKSLGDTPIDISSPPSGNVYVALNVTNGGVTNRHCTAFTACVHKVIAGGGNYKLICKGSAISDPSCTAAAPPPSGTTLEFVTTTGAGDCGDVKTGGAGGTTLLDLTCGNLYLGGGDSSLPAGGTPDGSMTIFNTACVAGTCTLSATTPGAVTANHCSTASVITGTACTTPPAVNNTTCTTPHGPTATCAADGFCHIPSCFFGTRLPIVNGGLSTCVTNSFRSNGTGSVSSGAGSGSMNVDLFSQPSVTGNATAPCPLCSGAPGPGTCSAVAANPGAACTGTNSAGNNYECVAATGSSLGEFQVNLGAVSTSGSILAGGGGMFCPGQVNAGAFGFGGSMAPTTVADYIDVSGSAAGTLSPGTHAVTVGTTFCIPATGNVLIDGSTDLPGPGAVALVGTWELVP
jgi:hypothetical protein